MLIIGPHWYNIDFIGNLILSIKSVTPVEIYVSNLPKMSVLPLVH